MTASTIIFYLLATMTLGTQYWLLQRGRFLCRYFFIIYAYWYRWILFLAAIRIYRSGADSSICRWNSCIDHIFYFPHATIGRRAAETGMGANLFAALAAFCGLALILSQILIHPFAAASATATEASVSNIGKQLLDIDQNGMALPFEVISILLLAAMIGCIVIAMRQPEENKIMNNEQGIMNDEG